MDGRRILSLMKWITRVLVMKITKMDTVMMIEVERKKRLDWEKEMRLRVKEIEDMRELKKKAEELTSREGDRNKGENSGDRDGDGDGEEQKRMRVRRELEKWWHLPVHHTLHNIRMMTTECGNFR